MFSASSPAKAKVKAILYLNMYAHIDGILISLSVCMPVCLTAYPVEAGLAHKAQIF